MAHLMCPSSGSKTPLLLILERLGKALDDIKDGLTWMLSQY